jgi:hypothetical protein
MPVTLRIFDVAGREVARVQVKGVEGPNRCAWDGTLANGARARRASTSTRSRHRRSRRAQNAKLILLSSR